MCFEPATLQQATALTDSMLWDTLVVWVSPPDIIYQCLTSCSSQLLCVLCIGCCNQLPGFALIAAINYQAYCCSDEGFQSTLPLGSVSMMSSNQASCMPLVSGT